MQQELGKCMRMKIPWPKSYPRQPPNLEEKKKLDEWWKASCPCQYLWIMNFQFKYCWEMEKHQKIWGVQGGWKVEIEGQGRTSPHIVCAKKKSENQLCKKLRSKLSVEACVLRNTHPNSIKFTSINNVSNVRYTLWWNGGTL